jgi:hypothetical protein
MSAMEHTDYLAKIGRVGGKIGGKSRSKAKVKASQLNAAKARKARKRKYPKCKGDYPNGAHRFDPNGRCYHKDCRYQR